MERPDEPTAPEADPPETDSPEAAEAPDLPAVAEAVANCVREALEQGEATTVPGLGTFRVEHRTSEWAEADDGSVSLTPPRDEVVFAPSPGAADASESA